MNTKTKIVLGLGALAVGVVAYVKFKPQVNRSSTLTLSLDNSKINPNFQKVLGI